MTRVVLEPDELITAGGERIALPRLAPRRQQQTGASPLQSELTGLLGLMFGALVIGAVAPSARPAAEALIDACVKRASELK